MLLPEPDKPVMMISCFMADWFLSGLGLFHFTLLALH